MTRQEIFDKVAAHLLTQGRRSVDDETNECVYRHRDGAMCAVGCLIPPELYDPKMEGVSVDHSPRVKRALNDVGIVLDSEMDRFLRDLQLIHDEARPEDWKVELIDFAVQHNLSYTSIEGV